MTETKVLAHVTESIMRAPLDDPVMAGFVFAFDTVSRAARQSPGFCWQLESRGRGHPVVDPAHELRVLSISTWSDYGALHEFVYRSAHGRALTRRQAWFSTAPQPSTALWWSAPDTPITIEAATARLAHLRAHGRRRAPSRCAVGTTLRAGRNRRRRRSDAQALLPGARPPRALRER